MWYFAHELAWQRYCKEEICPHRSQVGINTQDRICRMNKQGDMTSHVGMQTQGRMYKQDRINKQMGTNMQNEMNTFFSEIKEHFNTLYLL